MADGAVAKILFWGAHNIQFFQIFVSVFNKILPMRRNMTLESAGCLGIVGYSMQSRWSKYEFENCILRSGPEDNAHSRYENLLPKCHLYNDNMKFLNKTWQGLNHCPQCNWQLLIVSTFKSCSFEFNSWLSDYSANLLSIPLKEYLHSWEII